MASSVVLTLPAILKSVAGLWCIAPATDGYGYLCYLGHLAEAATSF